MLIREFMNSLRIGSILGWQDVRQAYRRSALGPFWITLGMAIQILVMGLIFSMIFKIELEDYFPFLATSIVLWLFMSSTITDACVSLISSEGIIRQLNLPFDVYAVRMLWKNVLNMAHNIVILPFVFIVFSKPVGPVTLLFIPGFLLLLSNLMWMTTLLGIVSARFRDFIPMVNSLITVIYFVTPIMWMPSSLGSSSLAHLLLGLNPIYHLMQIVRLPLVGEAPTAENWLVSIGLLLVGGIFSRLFLRRAKNQLAYWV